MTSVKVENISKSYGEIQAVKNLSFELNSSEIFGIIGPDGAGKTSLFRVLTTLLLPDSGTAEINGFHLIRDYKSIRSNIGYMPGRFSLYQDLTVEENLRVFAAIFNTSIEENYDLIKDIYSQIEPFKNRRAAALSGGMKQKLALSCALIHKPKVLFLDEPTTGVDPVSRKELWNMLKKLSNQGISILVSTPYMDEAKMCDRIALMQNGSFLKVDRPEKIEEDYKRILWSAKSDQMSRLLKDLRQHEEVDSCFAFGEVHHLTIRSEKFAKASLEEFLVKRGHLEVEIRSIKATVEDCFMELNAQ